jgi:ATP-binding cassette subfamily B protein
MREEPSLPGTRHAFDPVALRQLAEEHHGRFTSHRSQATTVYTLALPLRAVDTAAPVKDAMSRAHGSATAALAQRTIFLVDDHEDAREVLSIVIEERDARVEAFASGGALLSRLAALDASQWPDILICDIGLPDQDGYTVLRNVRMLEEQRGVPLARRIPAIALTGHAEAEDRTRALMAGFQIHLAKPVAPDELLAAIESLLKATPLRHANHETSALRNTHK